MSLFGRKKQPVAVPVDPEVFANDTVGPPLSHEGVVLLARLEGLADRLEGAVLRLERQADDDDEETGSNANQTG